VLPNTSSSADFKISVVNYTPDLKVQQVTSIPNSCGRWQMVNATDIADFAVQIVTSIPDFSVEYVTSIPGMP